MICNYCNDKGLIKVPSDQEAFLAEYDALEAIGGYTSEQCKQLALNKTGYTEIVCPACGGTKQVTDEALIV